MKDKATEYSREVYKKLGVAKALFTKGKKAAEEFEKTIAQAARGYVKDQNLTEHGKVMLDFLGDPRLIGAVLGASVGGGVKRGLPSGVESGIEAGFGYELSVEANKWLRGRLREIAREPHEHNQLLWKKAVDVLWQVDDYAERFTADFLRVLLNSQIDVDRRAKMLDQINPTTALARRLLMDVHVVGPRVVYTGPDVDERDELVLLLARDSENWVVEKMAQKLRSVEATQPLSSVELAAKDHYQLKKITDGDPVYYTNR